MKCDKKREIAYEIMKIIIVMEAINMQHNLPDSLQEISNIKIN